MPAFQDHFSSVAKQYAAFRPTYPAALFDALADLVPRDSVVWDCAAGNGQATVELAKRFARVIGTDASPEQVAVAKAHPHAEYRVALAEDSGLPERTIGLVTVAQALHWFDLPRFYAEVQRVLVPHGALAVWCYGIAEIEGAEIDTRVRSLYADTLGDFWPASRHLVETGYRTLPFPFEELSWPGFQMGARWTLDQLLGYLGTWSARQRYVEAHGRDPLPDLARELAAVWGNPHAPRAVTWPIGMRVGRAQPS